ncbi:hypothetical protein GCM10009582_14300 [Arthrobacter flavus]
MVSVDALQSPGLRRLLSPELAGKITAATQPHQVFALDEAGNLPIVDVSFGEFLGGPRLCGGLEPGRASNVHAASMR